MNHNNTSDIIEDLKNNSLEYVTEKYDLTLSELFELQKKNTTLNEDDYSYIRKVKYNRFAIQKSINDQSVYYGTYSSKKDAELIVDELKKVYWNPQELPRILKELNIKTKI